MSTWTHVAACIRVDDLRMMGFDSALPNLEARLKDVPEGSEGPLDFHIWVNPVQEAMAAYSVMISGDLRDFEDAGEIIAFLEKLTEDEMVRQGVATIWVDTGTTITLRHDSRQWRVVEDITTPGGVRKA